MKQWFIGLIFLLCGMPIFGEGEPVRIAFIYPQTPENVRPEHYFYGSAGEAGRLGARMAAEETGWQGQQEGTDFRVMFANAPNAASAGRAAERLIATENVRVLIGGFEATQAAELSRVASDRNVLFINVGSGGRTDLETSHTLSLMPSDTALLTSVRHSLAFDPEAPWLVVTQDHAASAHKADVAHEVLLAGLDTKLIEISTTAPVFRQAIEWLEGNPGAHVLVLLDWRHQLEFASQLEASLARPETVWVLPDSVTGTREYLGILRNTAPDSAAAIFAAWDATLGEGAELNQRFEAHYGMPMDTPAWASFHAVQLAFRALQEAPDSQGSTLRDYLIDLESGLNLDKSGNHWFEAENGDLLQDLYVLKLEPLEQGLSILQRQRQRVRIAETIPVQ